MTRGTQRWRRYSAPFLAMLLVLGAASCSIIVSDDPESSIQPDTDAGDPTPEFGPFIWDFEYGIPPVVEVPELPAATPATPALVFSDEDAGLEQMPGRAPPLRSWVNTGPDDALNNGLAENLVAGDACQEFSIEVFARPNSSTPTLGQVDHLAILANSASPATDFWLVIGSFASNFLLIVPEFDGENQRDARIEAPGPPLDQDMHVVAVVRPTSAELWLNGAVTQQSGSFIPTAAPISLRVGARDGDANLPWSGRIYSVAVECRALEGPEVIQRCNSVLGASCAMSM